MKTLTKKLLGELVEKALQTENPYISNSTIYAIDKVTHYIFADGKSYTKEELDTEYRKSAEKDIQNGYRDRMVGYYDKWYRYNKMDGGYAYDLGVKAATANSNCVSEMHIIEVIEAMG